MNDQEFAARLAALDEHHLRFLDELEKTNQRLAESRRQCTRETVGLLSGQSGQIADDLVEHKRDPDAHA